ncbi:MAG: serine/threonine-protein kinase, partial [bacterium]
MAGEDQNISPGNHRDAITPGTVIQHYRIVSKIGAGGMGEVYLADDTRLNRKVALKFLPSKYSSDMELIARFKREAQAAAALNHPNIVTIYEVGEYNNLPFFVMEHVEGHSLDDLIENDNLDFDEIINIAVQLCEGLSKAHRLGITHRDIKSSNIIIDSDNRARILDFGLAVAQKVTKLTTGSATLGTLSYMSPEQASGKEVTSQSDLWSLGVVLYEMLTG